VPARRAASCEPSRAAERPAGGPPRAGGPLESPRLALRVSDVDAAASAS